MLLSIITVISVGLGRSEGGKTAEWFHWTLPGIISKTSLEKVWKHVVSGQLILPPVTQLTPSKESQGQENSEQKWLCRITFSRWGLFPANTPWAQFQPLFSPHCEEDDLCNHSLWISWQDCHGSQRSGEYQLSATCEEELSCLQP